MSKQQIGPLKYDFNKWLITLTVITNILNIQSQFSGIRICVKNLQLFLHGSLHSWGRNESWSSWLWQIHERQVRAFNPVSWLRLLLLYGSLEFWQEGFKPRHCVLLVNVFFIIGLSFVFHCFLTVPISKKGHIWSNIKTEYFFYLQG